MNDKLQDEELLDLLLQDKLDVSGITELNTRREHPNFNTEYKKTIALKEVISDAGRAALKSKLNQIDQAVETKQLLRNRIIAVISILLTIAVLWFGWTKYNASTQVDTEILYAMYYAPHPNAIDPLTKGSSELQLTATQYYELGQYDRAISLLQSNSEEQENKWYLAQALMANQAYDKAELLLSSIIAANQAYKSESLWFSALINLKKGDVASAKSKLEEVSQTLDSGYGLKAKELLKLL